jgi:hypothetical protein
MCAEGRKDVIRSPNSTGSTLVTANTSNSRFSRVISTPLGSPIVPEV